MELSDPFFIFMLFMFCLFVYLFVFMFQVCEGPATLGQRLPQGRAVGKQRPREAGHF